MMNKLKKYLIKYFSNRYGLDYKSKGEYLKCRKFSTCCGGGHIVQVRHPTDSEGNKNTKCTYCYRCGTNVRNQKHCHGCGAKLDWSTL